MDKDRVLSFVIGLLSGSLVGAAVVILLTPQSGPELRKGVVDKINEIIDVGKQTVAERRRELKEEYQARIQIPLHSLDKEAMQST